MVSASKRWASRLSGLGFLVATIAVSTGCSSADGDLLGASGGTGGGNDTGFGTDGTGTPDDEDVETDTGPDPTGSSTTSDGPGLGTDGTSECPLDCGFDAQCENREGGPQCVCFDSDSAWSGSNCIQCVPASGSGYALDVPVIDATFRVTLDGGAFPQSLTEGGRVVLRSRDGLDEVELGPTGMDEYTASVVMGQYDVYYEFVRGGSQVPLNASANLGPVFVDDANVINLDVGRTLVSARITLNGEPPPDSQSNWGRVVLVNSQTGDQVPLGATNAPQKNLYVVPGTYRIHYRWQDGLTNVPRNTDAELGEIEIPRTTDPFELSVDIPMQEVSGSVYVNDELAPGSLTEYGALSLVNDFDPRDTLALVDTSEQTYTAKIIPGSYSVYYSFRAGGSTVPANAWGFVQSLADDSDIRIAAVNASGSITVRGQTPPDDASNDGSLTLRSGEGDFIAIGNTRDGTYSRNVMPGSYEVYYSQETANGLVPANTNARLRSLEVTPGGSSETIDVGMVQIDGTITLNSQLPPDSEYDDGRVYLRDPDSGDSVLLGNTRMGSFSKPVVPAVYDLVYVVEAAGNGVPVNTEALIARGVDIQSLDLLPVDIVFNRLGGSVTLNGQDPMAAGATIVLEDVVTGDEVFLGTLDDPTFDESLAAGRYLARYRGGPESYNGPENTDAAFACIEITAP